MSERFKGLELSELVKLLATIMNSLKPLHDQILERNPEDIWGHFVEMNDSNEKTIFANFLLVNANNKSLSAFLDIEVLKQYEDSSVKPSSQRGLTREGDGEEGRVSICDEYS